MDGNKFKSLKAIAILFLIVLATSYSEGTPQVSKSRPIQSGVRQMVNQLLFGGRSASSPSNYETVSQNFGGSPSSSVYYEVPSSSQEFKEHDTIVYDQPEGSHTTIYSQYEPTNEIDGDYTDGNYFQYSPYQNGEFIQTSQPSFAKPVQGSPMSFSSVVRHGRNVVNMMGSYLRTYLPITRRLAPHYEGYGHPPQTPTFQFIE